MRITRVRALVIGLVLTKAALGAEATQPDNGTDPTKQTRAVTLAYEHIELRHGF